MERCLDRIIRTVFRCSDEDYFHRDMGFLDRLYNHRDYFADSPIRQPVANVALRRVARAVVRTLPSCKVIKRLMEMSEDPSEPPPLILYCEKQMQQNRAWQKYLSHPHLLLMLEEQFNAKYQHLLGKSRLCYGPSSMSEEELLKILDQQRQAGWIPPDATKLGQLVRRELARDPPPPAASPDSAMRDPKKTAATPASPESLVGSSSVSYHDDTREEYEAGVHELSKLVAGYPLEDVVEEKNQDEDEDGGWEVVKQESPLEHASST